MCKRFSFAAAAAVMATGALFAGAGSASAGATWEARPSDSGATWESAPQSLPDVAVQQSRGATWE